MIAIDPAFYSIEALGREKNILGFLTDLVYEISEKTKMPLSIESVNWNTLFSGLQEEEYQGVFSGMPPYNFTENTYSFSSVFLKTGPVLVIPVKSPYSSLSKLNGREVGFIRGSGNDLLIEKYPGIIIRPYESIPKMLNDMATGAIDAALVGILPALGYCNDLFQGTLKVVSEPMTEAGLRLITLKNAQPAMMNTFDRELKKMQDDGTLSKLMQKWGLGS
jgi:ABC-type amino acid transport substrate-binding protein